MVFQLSALMSAQKSSVSLAYRETYEVLECCDWHESNTTKADLGIRWFAASAN